MVLLRLLLVVLAAVLFGVSASLSTDLSHKLTNAGLFCLAAGYALTLA